MADFQLQDKRVLVTGSTRGIGVEIARTFHKAGAEVIIHGRAVDLASQLAKELNTKFIIADLGEESSAESLIKELQNSKKILDILINDDFWQYVVRGALIVAAVLINESQKNMKR